MVRLIYSILFLLILVSVRVTGQSGNSAGMINTDTIFCITQDEMILYNLVNDFRRQNKLPDIPLSKSMCVVAKTHITDLLENKPQDPKCGFHSWSDQGNWKPCCYNKDPMGGKRMNSKPAELCGYQGLGFELVYWEEKTATANEAFELWTQVQASKDMILNKGKWQYRSWKAMGIGINEGFALIWLGDKPDKLADIAICGMDTLVQTKELAQLPVKEKNTLAEKITEPVTYTKPTVLDKNDKNVAPVKESAPLQKPVVQPVQDNKPSAINEKPQTSKPAVNSLPATNHFFVIVASLLSEDLANEKVTELKNLGYYDVMILPSAERFRIAIGSYSSEPKAKARLKELRETFPDCWLLRQ